MMSVSSVSGRGLAALLLVATLAVAARAADVGADASATLLNTADSADGSAELSVDSGDSSDMDLFRGRALLQAGTHTRQLPTSTRAAHDTQSNP